MNTIIHNPIISGFAPDPSILRVGTDYYIATSTFHWNPGVLVFHSKDLANWNLINRVFDADKGIDLRGTDTPAGIWAPNLSYDATNKTFWITISQMNSMTGRYYDVDNYAVYSKSITGPWSKPVYLNSIGFDPSLFHDDDGRHWLVTLQWETRDHYEDPGTIVLEEFDVDKQKVIGPTISLTKGGTDRGCVEAPHLYKRHGYYYLMTAEGGTGYGHSVVMQRSKKIEGPYESDPENPIITSTPYYYYRRNDPDASRFDLYNPQTSLQKAGHGSLVNTPNDEWYVAHLSARPLPGTIKSILGRETSIQKMMWTKDDWLRMEDGSRLAKETTPGITGIEISQNTADTGMQDLFNSNQIDKHLLSPYRQVTPDWATLKSRNGWLRLFGRQSFYSRFNVSLLACRADAFTFTATTTMEFVPKHFSQSAGLALYYDNKNWLFLRMTYDEHTNKPIIDLLRAQKASKEELTQVKFPLEGHHVKLKIDVNNGVANFSFREKDTQKWTIVLQGIDISYMSDEQIKGFTGLMIGIGTWDSYRHQSFADFDDFMVDDKLKEK